MKGLKQMSTDMTDVNINLMLGRLLAEVENLRGDFRRSEDKSDLSRASMHRRLDEMTTRVGNLETTVMATKDDVAEMKPVTEDVRKWKLMGLGALGVVGLGGAALGLSLAGAMQSMLQFFAKGH
jgi:hypothetical protein